MVRYEKIRKDITKYHNIYPGRETRLTIILDLYFSDQLFAYALGNDKENNKENNKDNDKDKDQWLHALHTCFMSLIGRQRSDKSCQRGGSINCSPQRLILTKRPEKKLKKNKSLLLVMEAEVEWCSSRDRCGFDIRCQSFGQRSFKHGLGRT